MTLHLTELFLLSFVGFFAGFIDAFGGGGGLIGLPTLLALGFAPTYALGTNKFQMCFGEFSAALTYFKHSGFSFKRIRWGLLFVVLGAILGAITIQYVHPTLLKKAIPFILLIILIYTSLKKPASLYQESESHQPKIAETTFFTVIGFFIGFYNGFFGPATGTLWTAAFMGLLAYDLKKAIMYTKPLNFIGNLSSLLLFISYSKVAYIPGLFMAVGNYIGGRCGAYFVVKHETKWIKRFFLAAVATMMVYLFIKYY